MHKKSFLKFITFLSLFGILIFLSYVFLNFGSLDFFLNDFFLGYELKKSLDPRYSFFQLFIFTIKYITKDIINHWFLLLPQLFFMLVFRKKIKALMLIFPILSVVLFHNLSVLVVSLLINLFIFCKVNLIFQKKNSVMILFPIIIFCITLGTNTNPVRHMQTSAMLYFLLIFHILCLYPINKKLKVAFIILFLSIHVSSNIKNNLYKPQRHLNNIFKQNIKIQIPQFNSDIYVDTFLKSYFDQTTSLKSKINNKKIKYLIDYTGRKPVLNLFFDLKFISQPWWTSGYSGSDNYVNKIQEISNTKKILNASLVVTYQSDNLQTLDINNLKKIGINLLDDYEILGIIDLQKYTKNNNWNFVVWKPKK